MENALLATIIMYSSMLYVGAREGAFFLRLLVSYATSSCICCLPFVFISTVFSKGQAREVASPQDGDDGLTVGGEK